MHCFNEVRQSFDWIKTAQIENDLAGGPEIETLTQIQYRSGGHHPVVAFVIHGMMSHEDTLGSNAQALEVALYMRAVNDNGIAMAVQGAKPGCREPVQTGSQWCPKTRIEDKRFAA